MGKDVHIHGGSRTPVKTTELIFTCAIQYNSKYETRQPTPAIAGELGNNGLGFLIYRNRRIKDHCPTARCVGERPLSGSLASQKTVAVPQRGVSVTTASDHRASRSD